MKDNPYLGFLPMHSIIKSINNAGIICKKTVYNLFTNADLFIKKQIYLNGRVETRLIIESTCYLLTLYLFIQDLILKR